MKKHIHFFFVAALGLSGCKDDPSPAYNAIITGFDFSTCICCGGLMINFENETKPHEGTFYLIENPESDLGINGITSFPIYANVSWTKSTIICSRYITIDSYKRVK